jgi:alginate O-acetyltransferase complex protein AlgI
MLFCTSAFVLFCSSILALYWLLGVPRLRVAAPLAVAAGYLLCGEPLLALLAGAAATGWLVGWDRARVWLLLAASFYFYSCWNASLALIVVASSAADWMIARWLDSSTSPRLRTGLMLVSVVGNLSLLCYFKYMNFFLHSLEAALRTAGLEATLPVLRIAAPIGISFYTFEALSYTVDVYLGRLRAERNLSHFMLFILFFPHLVAGPIVRGRDFLPQVRRRKRFNWERMRVGIEYVVLGLIKKMVIGDRMALYADPVFANPGEYGSIACWIGVIAYSVQIYCDFSGYTDIAIGVAHFFGFRLTKNFDMPYLATNVSDFWRRWHMSLSSWLRDYLFIPLGGSRVPTWMVYRNFLIVMLLGGLWHGAAWTFVVWGGLHGLFLLVHHAFRDVCAKRPWLAAACDSVPGKVASWGLTLFCVMAAWVFFRATTFTAAATLLGRLVWPREGMRLELQVTPYYAMLSLIVLGHLAGALRLRERAEKWSPAPTLGVTYAAGVVLALLFAADASKAFIYFQF